MHVRVDPQALYKAFMAVKTVLPAKSTLPALHHVQLVAAAGELRLAGTDLASGMVFPVPAEVVQEGEVVVPAKELELRLAALQERGQPITLYAGAALTSLPPNDLLIVTATASIPIKGMPPNEFVVINPVTPTELAAAAADEFTVPPVGRLALFDPQDLAAVLPFVAAAASKTGEVPQSYQKWWVLTYVWLEGQASSGTIRLMATDTTRMHCAEIPATVYQDFCVGVHIPKVLAQLQGMVTLAFRAHPNEPGWALLTLYDDADHYIVLNPATEPRPRGQEEAAQVGTGRPADFSFSCSPSALRQALAEIPSQGSKKTEPKVVVTVTPTQVTLLGYSEGRSGRAVVAGAGGDKPGRFVVYTRHLREALALGSRQDNLLVAFWAPDPPDDQHAPTFARISAGGTAYALLVPRSLDKGQTLEGPEEPAAEPVALAAPTVRVAVAPLLEALKKVKTILPSRAAPFWRGVLLEASGEGLQLSAGCPANDVVAQYYVPPEQRAERPVDLELTVKITVPAAVSGALQAYVLADDLEALLLRAKGRGIAEAELAAYQEHGLVVTLGGTPATLAGYQPTLLPWPAPLTPETIWPKNDPEPAERPRRCGVCGETIPPDGHWHPCIICGLPMCSPCATSGARCRTCDAQEITLAERVAEFDAAALAAAVAWVRAATSKEDTRPAMQGVWLEANARTGTGFWVVAADGFRLHLHPVPADRRQDFMLGLRHLDQVAKLLTGRVVLYVRGDKEVLLADGTTTISALRIDARFPDYRAILPTTEPTTTITVAPEALRSAATLVQRGITLQFRADPAEGLTMAGKDAEAGGEIPARVPLAVVTGPANKVALNPQYTLQALALNDGAVTVAIWSPDRPARFTYGNGALALVMPMQL